MKFSEHFGIELGGADDWFDPDLAVDTPLFLDPFLLLEERSKQKSLWAAAHDQLIGHFTRCYELLAKGANAGTLSEGSVRGLLSFPEPSELCLGYTQSGTSGSGSGAGNARLIIASIVTAIRAGLDRPEHIEEIGILNEGIGADRISDAACNVLKPLMIRYTKSVVRRHGMPTSLIRVRHAQCNIASGRWITEEHALPVNPFTGGAVLLAPKRFLNRLPILNADDWFDSTFNADLRRDLNVEVGQRVPKREIARLARRHPDRIRRWADELHQVGDVHGYDFVRDPLGITRWQDAGRRFAENNPLHLRVQSPEDLTAFAKELLDLYQLFIQEQGGWKLLWNDDGTEKPEEAAQLALLGMARPYCRSHGVEIDREVDLGRGPVDFKLTSGPAARLLIEVKKLHTGSFWNGLESRLPSYLTSDGTSLGWLLAIKYRTQGVSKARPRELAGRVAALNKSLGTSIDFAVIDARSKVSASKIRGRKR